MTNLTKATEDFVGALKAHFESFGSDAFHALAPFEERVKALALEAERIAVNWTKKAVAEVEEVIEGIEESVDNEQSAEPLVSGDQVSGKTIGGVTLEPASLEDGQVQNVAASTSASTDLVMNTHDGSLVVAAETDTAGGNVTEASEDPAPAA